MNARRLFWLGFIGVALLLTLIPELLFDEQEQLVEALVPAATTEQGALADLRSTAAASVTPAPTSTAARVPHADLFAAHSWYVAPPVPAAPVMPPRAAMPPPAPVAPPLPFRFIGSLDDNRQLLAFLLRGEQLYSVRTGDVIDGVYRVEDVQQTGMTLTYLPLRISQSLLSGSEP